MAKKIPAKLIKKGNSYFPGAETKKKAWLKDNSIYKESPLKFWEKQAKELLYKTNSFSRRNESSWP